MVMRLIFPKFLLAFTAFFLVSAANIHAQKLPKCVKVAKSHRTNWLLVETPEVNKFYKNFDEDVAFGNLKIVKSELSFYLIADEKNGKRIFAFELEQKGKRLFLNKFYPVQTCDQGDLSLDTFLQLDGKIQGCRKGNHSITQLEKKK